MARSTLGCGLFFLVQIASQAQQQHFSGSTEAGRPYIHSLGRGLALVVTTSAIRVQSVPIRQFADDFTGCVTPPFHGPNPTSLEAWQFLDSQNEGLTGNEMEILRVRDFQFTLNPMDNKRACENLSVASYTPPSSSKDGSLVYGIPGYEAPPLGTGKVFLSEIKFSSLGPGKHAEIHSLRFDAAITLPHIAETGHH